MTKSEGLISKLNKNKTLIITVLNLAVLVIVISVALIAVHNAGLHSNTTTQSTTSSTTSSSTYRTTVSTTFVTVPTTTTVNQSELRASNSSILGCSPCFGVFLYTVNENDTLSSIAHNYGLNPTSVGTYNNITSVYPGEQILLPFYFDTIETDLRNWPNQNNYDYYILMYSVEYNLNPMLIKAQVFDESNFNSNVISSHDAAPGVCGTGHSYGLLQYTPTCFVGISNFGIVDNFSPNAQVLLGQNNGNATINCLTTCSHGDYFVSEYSDVLSSSITTDLVQQSKYSGWNNSVFNPRENLFGAMYVERIDIDAMIVAGYTGCTYAQYNEMALAQYQQSTTWVITGCGEVRSRGSDYIGSVLADYQELARNSVYGWTDEY